jgi:putative peptidoglycan lipid II flippase
MSSEARLLHSSSLMAAGTVTSRISGLFKTVALVAAVGTGVFADTYYNANILPTIIYTLFIGGAINAVFVPQLVRHMQDDEDEGNAYAQRLFTAVAGVLLVVTVVAVVAAPLVMRLYSSGWNERQLEVATAFARFMLPQIFFLGMFTVLAQILNSRGRFGAPMFAPVVNNIVVIVAALMFLWVAGTGTTTRTVTPGEIALLGVGTSLGTIAQVVVLLPFLRRTGVSLRPRTDLKGHGLGKAWSLARWTIGLVLINQIGTLFIIRLATRINVDNTQLESGSNVYGNAFILFMLPQSVITVSIVTALLPQLSRLAHDGAWDTVRERMGWALRTTASVIVPAAAVLMAFGPALGLLLFGYGSSGSEGGRQIGLTAAAFAVGLPAFSAYYTLMRGYYALEDTRSPTVNAVLLNSVNVLLAHAITPFVPPVWKIPALGLAYALSYWIAVVPLWIRLGRRLGGLHTHLVVRTFVRVTIATALATAVALAVFLSVRLLLGQPVDTVWAVAVALALALTVGGGAYLGLARLMRIEELRPVVVLVTRHTRLGA